jgi:hypothetical protein
MERPIRIREVRSRDTSVRVEIVPGAPGAPLSGFPRILTFRFRRRLIVCTPTWGSSGRLEELEFPCPRLCDEAVRYRAGEPFHPVTATSNGAVTVSGCVICRRCDLHLHIVNGRALEGEGGGCLW